MAEPQDGYKNGNDEMKEKYNFSKSLRITFV